MKSEYSIDCIPLQWRATAIYFLWLKHKSSQLGVKKFYGLFSTNGLPPIFYSHGLIWDMVQSDPEGDSLPTLSFLKSGFMITYTEISQRVHCPLSFLSKMYRKLENRTIYWHIRPVPEKINFILHFMSNRYILSFLHSPDLATESGLWYVPSEFTPRLNPSLYANDYMCSLLQLQKDLG